MRRSPPYTAWRRAALAAGLALALAGCGDRRGADRPPEANDVAVAKVDDRAVWASDVKREAVAQGLIGEGEPLDVSSEMFRRVLDQVIDQRLLAAEAQRRGLDKSPEGQRRLAAARERALADLLVERVVSDNVDDKAVRQAYEEQLKAPRTEEIRARQIVVATAADAEAVKKLVASGASFEALAMERSTDQATRFNGGDLGYFTTDVMPEAYQAALRTAKPGELVGPFPVEGGFTLVRVEDRRVEAPITLDAARPQIVRFLTYGEIRELIESLRDRAKRQNKVEYSLRGAQAAPGRAPEPADAAPAAPAPKSEGASK
ncbi:peptidylprolyl isomerase [Phenylobacterium sp.]|uniref:peptidylprolyl isomerase n=1 Tax=Phenylobacterium sp. TaxID=1871053 RepID=UPI002E30D527|nr:peptidyl-prolyl cis-trans isomerase [Phenylobacterium sp.]HEX2560107.1 peptidyl-prolyl cis-trans isomerase [Phenylobacterium sp.]